MSLVGDYLSIASALFGVVIAGFAIAAALVNERYAQMLNDAGTDPFRLLRHFVFEGALLVTAILAAIAYRAAGPTLYVDHRGAEQALLFLATLLFLWGLFFALELMKLVLGVAVTSAALFRLSSPPNESSGESRPDSE